MIGGIKKLRCYFCGETRSVKYEKEVFDPAVSNKPTEVCVCNKCALKMRIKGLYEIIFKFSFDKANEKNNGEE